MRRITNELDGGAESITRSLEFGAEAMQAAVGFPWMKITLGLKTRMGMGMGTGM